jgi:hypothetical protein
MNHTAQTQRTDLSRFLRRSPSLFMVVIFLLVMPGLGSAAVMASLDRNTIHTGDSAILRITTSGDDVGNQPDLAPLRKDFEILGTSTSNQIQIINGQRSEKYEWLIELEPLTKGTIQVPALDVGNSKTPALTLNVSEQPASATAQAGDPIFIRSEINSSQSDTYVQQQILYTTRLYYRIPLIEGSFTDPKIDNAVLEQLGNDKQYNTTIDGQNYQVLERSYAIYPEHSGRLTITPTIFNGRTVSATGRQSAFGRMDSLFEQMLSQRGLNNQFFGGTPFGSAGKRVRLASNTLTLEVKPQPASYHGAHWLPTQNLVLHDSWAKTAPVIHAGEPVTRTLTLEAKGLEASQLPNLQLQGTDNLRIYPEQPELSNRTDGDWIYGRSEQRFTYVASQPGKLSIPAIHVSWWDTVNHKQQNTVIPAWDITIKPASGSYAAATAATSSKSVTPKPAPQTTNSSNSPAPAKSSSGSDKQLYWQLGIGLGIGMVLVLAFLLIRRSRKPTVIPPITQSNDNKAPHPIHSDDTASLTRSRHALRVACGKSDPQAATVALLDWAATTWPDQPPRSLGALAARVQHGAGVLRELEAALYGADRQKWDGQALWKQFSDGLLGSKNRAASGNQPDTAPPLYPDWHQQAG